MFAHFAFSILHYPIYIFRPAPRLDTRRRANYPNPARNDPNRPALSFS